MPVVVHTLVLEVKYLKMCYAFSFRFCVGIVMSFQLEMMENQRSPASDYRFTSLHMTYEVLLYMHCSYEVKVPVLVLVT